MAHSSLLFRNGRLFNAWMKRQTLQRYYETAQFIPLGWNGIRPAPSQRDVDIRLTILSFVIRSWNSKLFIKGESIKNWVQIILEFEIRLTIVPFQERLILPRLSSSHSDNFLILLSLAFRQSFFRARVCHNRTGFSLAYSQLRSRAYTFWFGFSFRVILRYFCIDYLFDNFRVDHRCCWRLVTFCGRGVTMLLFYVGYVRIVDLRGRWVGGDWYASYRSTKQPWWNQTQTVKQFCCLRDEALNVPTLSRDLRWNKHRRWRRRRRWRISHHWRKSEGSCGGGYPGGWHFVLL